MYRFPADTCPKAGAILEELCSLPVDIDPQALFAGGRARRNCTHLFDIAVLALTFIPKKEVERTFDFFIPDAHGPDRILRACVNGIVVHDWRVEDEIITAPASLSGIDMARGFIGQMTKVMSGVDLETALMLQKSLHVARGRLRISDQSPGRSLADAVDMLGACYTYSQPRFSVAVEVGGYIRDFSNGVEETPWPD